MIYSSNVWIGIIILLVFSLHILHKTNPVLFYIEYDLILPRCLGILSKICSVWVKDGFRLKLEPFEHKMPLSFISFNQNLGKFCYNRKQNCTIEFKKNWTQLSLHLVVSSSAQMFICHLKILISCEASRSQI